MNSAEPGQDDEGEPGGEAEPEQEARDAGRLDADGQDDRQHRPEADERSSRERQGRPAAADRREEALGVFHEGEDHLPWEASDVATLVGRLAALRAGAAKERLVTLFADREGHRGTFSCWS